MEKQTIIEMEGFTSIKIRDEKIMQRAELEMSKQELESQNTKKPSDILRRKIASLEDEIFDLETELSHVEEDIENQKQANGNASSVEVNFDSLEAAPSNKKNSISPPCPQCAGTNSKENLFEIKFKSPTTEKQVKVKGLEGYLCPDCSMDWSTAEQHKRNEVVIKKAQKNKKVKKG